MDIFYVRVLMHINMDYYSGFELSHGFASNMHGEKTVTRTTHILCNSQPIRTMSAVVARSVG